MQEVPSHIDLMREGTLFGDSKAFGEQCLHRADRAGGVDTILSCDY
ncbi:hypothetical protein DSBG_4474 [Desulfosporosinus sp. BG]|nr:hypothetical protein DSBG_4474 [Desulfosporosinus sp. BG]